MAKKERFEKVYSQGKVNVMEIWVDKETGVNYVFHASGYSGGMDKLRSALAMLSEDEQNLVNAIFFQDLSEREWSNISGIPQKTINDRKRRILAKLKKILEK